MVMGNQVAGGVIAYQFCMVAFLAPYAILAQPIHTTILPELSHDVADGDMGAFAERLRWGLDGMVVTLVPVAAAFVALARPAMDVIAPSNGDVELFAGRARVARHRPVHLRHVPAARPRLLRARRQPHARARCRGVPRCSAPR